MTNTAEESHTDGFQISDSVKKKKKKRRLDRETHGQHAGIGFRSPLSPDHSSIFSWRSDDQASEDSKALQKKAKKKAKQETSDSQLDYSCITTESELTSEAGTGVYKPKKKKKRKPSPSEQDDGDWLCVPLSQGKAGSQPKANCLGNGDWSDRVTPVKKKAKAFIAKQNEPSEVSARPMKNRTDSASSDKHEEAGHRSAEDSDVELFTSSLCKTQHLSFSQENVATKLGTPNELGSPFAPRKPRKHKESSAIEDSDSTDITPRKPQKHKKSGLEDPDSANVTSRKPRKRKESSGVEDSDSTDITPRKPQKHKNPGLEDPDSANVTSRKPRKRKESSGVEDSDSTDITPRKPQKHKKSGLEDPDSANVTSRKPRKRKESSGVEDADSTDVTPRKPQKHKESSGMEDADNTFAAPLKPQKHKKSYAVEYSDNTDVTPRKPRKHKESSGVEDSDSTDVIPRKPKKHKESSAVEGSDSNNVTLRKPHKHKESSAVEDTDSTFAAPLKPQKHKKSYAVEDSDNTDVTPRKPCKHKKSSVEDSNSTEDAPRKPRKHKKSGMEDPDTTDIDFEVEETVKSVTNHDRIENGSPAKRFPLEDSSDRLPKTPKDGGGLLPTEHPASQSFFVADNEFLDSSRIVMPDLETATQELEEFIPHVRNLSASAIKQMVKRDLVRFKNFKRKGIAVKFGRFSEKENDQLRKNVEAFLQHSGIESAEKLLFAHRFPEERATISKQKTQHLFGIRIAEGIARPWRLVYYRARKIFDPNNHSRRYSDEEKKKLMEYQAMYGNNWKKISELMSRSSHSVALKYSQIKSEPKSGPWSKEETKRLIQAVEEMLRTNHKEFSSALEEEDEGKALSVVRENLYKGISWMKVEAVVRTRHWRQCKQKWISIVTKRMSSGRVMAHGFQNMQFRINLIERLYELNIEEAHEVDWEVLSRIIGDVPPDYIQSRFYKLKATHVPFWNQKTFPEIIDHLYKVTLPKLKASLKRKGAKYAAAQVKEQRKVFEFQDIFQESSDELIDDDSEEELKAGGGTDGSESS